MIRPVKATRCVHCSPLCICSSVNCLFIHFPKGATIRRDKSTGAIVVARIMRGGAADKSGELINFKSRWFRNMTMMHAFSVPEKQVLFVEGLIHEGDELKEVNGVSLEDKKPKEIPSLLVRLTSALRSHFSFLLFSLASYRTRLALFYNLLSSFFFLIAVKFHKRTKTSKQPVSRPHPRVQTTSTASRVNTAVTVWVGLSAPNLFVTNEDIKRRA